MELEGVDNIAVKGKPFMEIGQSKASCTSLPKPYYDKSQNIIYCDLPGLADNRSETLSLAMKVINNAIIQ